MIQLNMSDVISILNLCRNYLIALGVLVFIAVVAMMTNHVFTKVSSDEKSEQISGASTGVKTGPKYALRALIRREILVGLIAGIVVIANLVSFGPLSTLLTLSTGGSGNISASTIRRANQHIEDIAGEGIVLLKNGGAVSSSSADGSNGSNGSSSADSASSADAGLPLQKNSKLNVFGWSSARPVYGGSGAGALNDIYERVSLTDGLKNAGFQLNPQLEKFYAEYDAQKKVQRGAVGNNPKASDWTLPEPTVKDYEASQSLLDSAREYSSTAVVVLARTGGEGDDLPADMSKVNYTENSSDYKDFEEGRSYLQLSRTERDLLNLVNERFENVVVVYDGLNPLEFGFLNDYDHVKSALWVAGPGQTGFNALGRILSGETNPSGKTTDTLVYDQKQTPWWNNVGNFAYTNMNEFMVDKKDPYMGGAVPTFVNYVEGIYVGYRWFETAAAEGVIDYARTVQFPFGYGLSYTQFAQTMSPVRYDAESGKISVDVTVTNTGSVAGKDVVQVYGQPPYTAEDAQRGIEKASTVLLGFEKTKLLQPGESQTVSVELSVDDLASYDAKNAKAYVLEAGDYGISVQADSHTVLAQDTVRVPETIVYNSAERTHAGDKIPAVNQFEYAEGSVNYLSRANRFANFAQATAAPDSFEMPEAQKAQFINTSNYPHEKDDSAQMPKTGVKGDAQLSQMRGKAYDDPAWESVLDQLTIPEMQDLIAHGGFQTAAAPSVGKSTTVDVDGPSALSNNFTKKGSVGFPSAVMIAATWNKDMARTYGSDMGQMADELGASGWYAPSMNLHRSALEGRAYEYFSEDPVISGVMASQAISAAWEKGVYGYMKHFALNEQETNRWSMICEWIQEQALRELYLKPFEMSVKQGGAKAVMSSFNYIGPIWAGGNKQLLTTVLRDEWGFRGFVDTDYFAGSYYMSADQVIAAGGANTLSTFDVGTNYVSDVTNPVYVQYMRRAAHDIFYTVVNSRAYAAGNTRSGMETWMKVAIGLDVVLALVAVGVEVLIIRAYRKRKA
ncbi:glycoside hydrolase family 3 N-terminal domain-containing protein [Alloscardovia macacae]|uniref:Beta-glucosidase n=1 Tax=Alloscardovia macacae TaxID=1160091 RepID=A0A261F710_9BIFI|nr:glycoside hydrolase family 3 N-terminal domain-containing protein [Alloscardovia macacae]OZG54676.1 beta-glucosidase [Alloscardovia macacae]